MGGFPYILAQQKYTVLRGVLKSKVLRLIALYKLHMSL